jgi:hypothetical protein
VTAVALALAALAFAALCAFVVGLGWHVEAQLQASRKILIKHTTRCARVLAAQRERDRRAHEQAIKDAVAAIVDELGAPLAPGDPRAGGGAEGPPASAAPSTRKTPPAGTARHVSSRSPASAPPRTAILGDDEATPPSGWTLEDIRARVAPAETGGAEGTP